MKKVKAVVKLQIEAGKANPAPPVGPALAQHGINLMQFCKEYNARTSSQMGNIIPAEITIYIDGSFKFVENVKLFSSHPEYAYLNTIQVWGVGTGKGMEFNLKFYSAI